jgi:hypothetical protein
MDDESYFTAEAMSDNSKICISLNIPQQQKMSNLFASEYNINEPVFLKYKASLSIRNCTYPNIHQYFISLSKNSTNRKKSFSGLIPFYANETLVRVEELKVSYIPKREMH